MSFLSPLRCVHFRLTFATAYVLAKGGGAARLLRLLGLRFDWFCGLDARVVRKEAARAASRCGVHWASGALAAWPVLGGGYRPPAAAWVAASVLWALGAWVAACVD
jgi:hypothetical protein